MNEKVFRSTSHSHCLIGTSVSWRRTFEALILGGGHHCTTLHCQVTTSLFLHRVFRLQIPTHTDGLYPMPCRNPFLCLERTCSKCTQTLPPGSFAQARQAFWPHLTLTSERLTNLEHKPAKRTGRQHTNTTTLCLYSRQIPKNTFILATRQFSAVSQMQQIHKGERLFVCCTEWRQKWFGWRSSKYVYFSDRVS